jgi:hypothetical protein
MTTFTRPIAIAWLTLSFAACGGKDQQDLGAHAAAGSGCTGATDCSPAPTTTATTTPTTTATTTPTTTATTSPTTSPTMAPTTAPPAPPANSDSFTLNTDYIDVPIGGETFKCQNYANPVGKDVDFVQSESVMSAGSHHMFAFREQGLTDGSLVDCSGLEFTEFVHSAQTPEQTLTYPSGVGRYFPATDGVRILAHYLNTTSKSLHAQVSVTFHYVDTSQVQAHAAGIFLNIATLFVRPGQSTVSHSYTLPYDIKLLGGVSHMHRHAVSFTSSTSDGRVIYQGTDWNEPKEAVFDPPMDIGAGTSISWSCSYNNTTGQTLTFGESAATNEMCIFSGTFYPAPGGTGINSLF